MQALSKVKGKTNIGLAEFCKKALADGCGYVYGTFGQVCTVDLLNDRAKTYPDSNLAGGIMRKVGEKWLGKRVVDCSGLIKYYLMCDKYNDNPKYNSIIDCNISYDKATIKGTIDTLPEMPGVLVHMPGHVGVYIGGGKVIEARGTMYGVVKTKVRGRGWTKWSQSPFIEYENNTAKTKVLAVGSKVQITAEDAIYTNGVKVPSSIKNQPYTVIQISCSGKQVLLKEIYSWVDIKYLTLL